MMKITSQAKAEIDAAFPEGLTPAQIWLVVKIAKHVRLRCRNNAAFNNWFNSVFPAYRFRQVPKKRADGSPYEGLQIMNKEGQPVGSHEETEE
jgi:hypothetical protein